MERRVSVRALNQQTSAVLGEVARGKAVTITSAGRPIARIIPCAELPEAVQILVDRGSAIAPSAAGAWTAPPPTPGSHVDVAAAIAEAREAEPW